MPAGPRVLLVCAPAAAGRGATMPPWDYVPASREKCVNASAASSPPDPDNARWVVYALPEGTPPAGGWPVYLHLVTDRFVVDGDCGIPSPSVNCTPAPGVRCPKPFSAFATPEQALSSCHPSDGSPGRFCYYEQEAGAMWDQRLKQGLVSSGVAVLQANPVKDDSWDSCPEQWDGYTLQGKKYGGADRPFLQVLFREIAAGGFGPLDVSRVVIRGWSSGAAMVSWLFEAFARNGTALFPGVGLAGGVMLSGGSYTCYADPWASGRGEAGPPRQPVGSCAGCSQMHHEFCSGDPQCSSCDAAVKPYCSYCCPYNYTEAWYDEHPDGWGDHPPVFLAQTSTVDDHADLCASRNYHDTLVAHGVGSTLVLVPEEDMSCFCVGNPTEPAAAGSPYASVCASSGWGQNCSNQPLPVPDCCITHTLGFATMVEPAINFVLDVTT